MDKRRRIGPGHPMFEEMVALTSTVRIMLRARGKKNPEDVPFGSPEWDVVGAQSMHDVYRAMGGDPDEPDKIDL
ncbi:hypothetical protein [Paraburkholderia strydomiana]|uniref:hypothetical protein n=1 Tax=Paraburkholderia strydomiana TaxID=1245417 RepID=UPI001BECBBF5|nr:hypothetical protein [Paraburkholderia strydomiana]MBT2792732.1 hypothetical protein [Paraburkholderia strydomiana]